MEWLHTGAGEEQWQPTNNERQKVPSHTPRLGARVLSMKHLLEMLLQLKEEIRKNGVCSSCERSPFLLREDGMWPPGPIRPAKGFFYIPWTNARRHLITQVSNVLFLVSSAPPLKNGNPRRRAVSVLRSALSLHPPRAEMGTSPTFPPPVQLCSKDFISRFVN